MRSFSLQAVAAGVLGVALAGCQDPWASSSQAPSAGQPARTAPATAPPSGTGTPAAGAPTARAAARAFAQRWVNWDWGDAAAQQRVLARLAHGPLAAQLRAGARAAAADRSLERDRPGARGSVLALQVEGDDRRATALAVTRERTYTDGHADLGGERHRVYRAGLERTARGWSVSEWTPLP